MRSLETNWLSRFDKSLVRPEVVFTHDATVNGESVGGYYIQPGNYEWNVDGRFYECRFGLIVSATKYGGKFARACIAHEWRHHWQLHNGIKFDHHNWHLPKGASWDDAIRRYFRESRSEMDALLFERKVAPHLDNEIMLDVVMGGGS